MKIVYIIGPSGSGKDMVFGRLREFFMDSLNPIVMYTNRPMRPGEIDGKTYHYRLLDELKELDEKGLIIEKREYNTIHGLWIYATVDDGSFTEDKNYIGIGTLESLSDLQKYFGADKIIPLFVYVNDDNRIMRTFKREDEGNKNYKEFCRRWLADEADFKKEKIESVDPIFLDNNGPIEITINNAIEIINNKINDGGNIYDSECKNIK